MRMVERVQRKRKIVKLIYAQSLGSMRFFDNYAPDLKETLVLEEQGDQNFIVDDSYNKFEVEKDDY